MSDRDRDEAGRPRSARPRDTLGRPLPHGSATVEPPVDVDLVRPAAETLAVARELLAAGRPFTAHEVLEAAWKQSTGRDRAVWRALAQLAVGITHAARGNRTGALALLERGAAGLAAQGGRTFHGLALDAVRRRAEALRAELESGAASLGGVGALLGGLGEVAQEAGGHPLDHG